MVGDAGDAEIVEAPGSSDNIVVAYNIHMDTPMSVQALRNTSRLRTLHGYLFVSGADLEVRTTVSHELGWKPVEELLQEIYDRDPCMKGFWLCHNGGLEPLNKKRREWRRRYAAAFQLISARAEAANSEEPSMATEDGRRGPVERAVPAMAFAAGDAVRLSA